MLTVLTWIFWIIVGVVAWIFIGAGIGTVLGKAANKCDSLWCRVRRRPQ